jgi:hypothetical protein
MPDPVASTQALAASYGDKEVARYVWRGAIDTRLEMARIAASESERQHHERIAALYAREMETL